MPPVLPYASNGRGFEAYPVPTCKGRTWIYVIATIVGLCLAYRYVIDFHNVDDFGQLVTATSALMLPRVNDRCRLAAPGQYKCLANVMFIGASKCGTTSLANHLGYHPGVEFVQRRMNIDGVHEIHRFDRPTYGYAMKLIDIADELASAPPIKNLSQPLIHYTPHYLYAPTVPFEMKEFYPDPETLKFIIMIREPVSRAISSYWFKNSHLFNEKSKDRGSVHAFTKEIYDMMVERQRYDHCVNMNRDVDELTRLRTCFGPALRDPMLGHRHVDKGIYYDQLERWFALYPRENFLIVTLEEFSSNPVKQFEKVCKFLGVEMVGPNAFDNVASVESVLGKAYLGSPNDKKTGLPPKVLEDLTNFYRPYNRKLEELLGRKLGYPT